MSSAKPVESGQDDKLLGIELLRFASAIAVLVFHYQHFAFVGQVQEGFTQALQPFFSPLRLLYQYGFYGVQVFWCISGFIFYWKYARSIAAGKVSGYSFLILRLTRLYPLHFITLLFMAVMQHFYFAQYQAFFVYPYNDWYHFALQLLMASDWGLQAGESFNGPIWSISIEVLVYTLFFFSLRLLSDSPRRLLAILVAAVVIITLGLSNHPFFYCVMFFYAGCFTAIAHGVASQSKQYHRWMTTGSLLIVVAAPLALLKLPVSVLNFLFVFSPALIFLCVNYIRPGGVYVPLLSAAGNITYASYLLHVPVQILICLLLGSMGMTVPWQVPGFFTGFIVGMLILSLLCHAWFEMPMQSLLRAFLLKRPATKVTPVQS